MITCLDSVGHSQFGGLIIRTKDSRYGFGSQPPKSLISTIPIEIQQLISILYNQHLNGSTQVYGPNEIRSKSKVKAAWRYCIENPNYGGNIGNATLLKYKTYSSFRDKYDRDTPSNFSPIHRTNWILSFSNLQNIRSISDGRHMNHNRNALIKRLIDLIESRSGLDPTIFMTQIPRELATQV